MNIALEQTEEYVNGVLTNSYGDAFVRGNNGEHCHAEGADQREHHKATELTLANSPQCSTSPSCHEQSGRIQGEGRARCTANSLHGMEGSCNITTASTYKMNQRCREAKGARHCFAAEPQFSVERWQPLKLYCKLCSQQVDRMEYVGQASSELLGYQNHAVAQPKDAFSPSAPSHAFAPRRSPDVAFDSFCHSHLLHYRTRGSLPAPAFAPLRIAKAQTALSNLVPLPFLALSPSRRIFPRLAISRLQLAAHHSALARSPPTALAVPLQTPPLPSQAAPLARRFAALAGRGIAQPWQHLDIHSAQAETPPKR